MINGVPAVILEEEVAINYNPDPEEIIDYAEFLGMDVNNDQEFFYIAKEGLKAPLPDPWKPVQDAEEELYFYNFETQEIIKEHPCDEYYKDLYREEKAKKEQKIHEKMIQEGKLDLNLFIEQERLAQEEEQIIQEMQVSFQPPMRNSGVNVLAQVAPSHARNPGMNSDVAEFTAGNNYNTDEQMSVEETESSLPDAGEYEDERIGNHCLISS